MSRATPMPPRDVAGVDAQAELLGLAGVALDLLWVHPLLALPGGPAPDGTARVALWPLLALAALARALIWLLAARRVAGPAFTAVTGVAGLLSLAGLVWLTFYTGPGALPAAGFPGAFVSGVTGPGLIGVVLAGLYAWRQTLRGDVLDLGQAYARFQWIVLTYILYTAVVWLFHGDYLPPVLTRDLFVLFLAGLWATALARSRMEGARSHRLLSTRWFVFSLALIAGVLGAGLLVGSLFAPGLAAALFGPLVAALEAVGLVVLLVVEGIAALLFFALDFLFGWIRLAPAPPPTITPTPAPDPYAQLRELFAHGTTGPPFDPTLLAFVGGAILLAVFLLLARKILRNAAGRRRTLAQGERESLLNWNALLASLRPAAAPPPPPDPLLALAANPAYHYTVRVRQIYRQALARAAAREVRRLPAQTADEVLPALQGVFPAARTPLATLTALYDATRYTATPAPPTAAAAAEEALRALEAAPDDHAEHLEK